MINKKHFYCYLVAHPTMSSHRHHRDIYSLAMCCHHRDRLQDRCVGGSAQDGRPAFDLLAVHRHRSLALRHGCRSISSYCHSHRAETVSQQFTKSTIRGWKSQKKWNNEVDTLSFSCSGLLLLLVASYKSSREVGREDEKSCGGWVCCPQCSVGVLCHRLIRLKTDSDHAQITFKPDQDLTQGRVLNKKKHWPNFLGLFHQLHFWYKKRSLFSSKMPMF